MNRGVVSAAAPRMGLRPIPGGGCAPAPPKTFLRKKNLRVSCPLPLVGTETYTLFGCLSRPWVTFSFGPTETGLGYIIKWLDRDLRRSGFWWNEANCRDWGRRPAVHLGERWIVYCPQCRVEFREGFTECSDCRVPLLAGTPPPEPDPFDPALGLVVVLETNDGVQLALAKGLLEEAGIPFFVLGQIATLVQDVDGFLHKWVRVQVPRDREAEARELLEGMLQAETGPQGAGEEGAGEPGESA